MTINPTSYYSYVTSILRHSSDGCFFVTRMQTCIDRAANLMHLGLLALHLRGLIINNHAQQ